MATRRAITTMMWQVGQGALGGYLKGHGSYSDRLSGKTASASVAVVSQKCVRRTTLADSLLVASRGACSSWSLMRECVRSLESCCGSLAPANRLASRKVPS